ncbi:serine/threonine-protein kinase [Nannocystis bainbridge]|uniref:non-specific serine/threonine protein kinase n=1 Tax=Nannocystis bainbridge TaxID=2995303 RepID=A0ABT5DWV0_9BACT|nr:serine/threonine-protein kinase [Nannocystis bainbridge]MDC0717579.1 protein kinase [Nannocystis bainbridge]
MHKDAPADAPDGDSFAAQFAAAEPPRPREAPAEHARARLAAQLFGAASPVQPLGPYAVLRELGHGAMGVVHEGRGPGDQQVALKTLRRPDPAAIARLKREFRNVVDVGHANLVAVYELALDPARGEWYIAMEYVPGDSWLAHLRPAGGRAPEAVIRAALAQLCSGVYALHRAGLLHRDLKPSNVLVSGEGRLKIVDFGLAQLADGGYEGLAGTAGYLAPELLAGAPPSPASDWFAVGVMLYEALSGRRPRVPPGPTPIDGAPADLLALCRDLLAENPAARPSGRDLLLRLGLDAPPTPSPVFVGRAGELATCVRALERPPALLLLVGPSGAGKSALLAHLAADLRDRRGALVLHGRCYAGESVPYKALDGVVEALAKHLETCPEKHVLSTMPEESADLRRVFPALQRAVGATGGALAAGAVPRETRRRAVAALRRLLTELARARPIVLAIDDLQWGDADSARLLGELLAPPDSPAIVVAASVRSDVRPTSAFFAELDAAPLACPIHEVALAPLGPADAEQLAATILAERPGRGDDPGLRQRLAAAIARESQGSPLFIEAIAQRRGDAAADVATSLDGALQAEVAALEPGERHALERLAVAGRPLRRDLALRQGPGAAARVLDGAALAVLGARRLVRPSGEGDSVETYHDRVREVVLLRLGAAERRAHHRVLALALAAARDPDPDELVLHFHGADERELACAWALRAAERAAAALAFARAAALYEKALSWGTYPSEHVLKYTIARAEALVHAGRCAEAAPVYLTAAALAPTRLQELELRGRAVEHYLVSGRVDAGLRVLGPLAHELGLPFPASTAGTVLRLLTELARLALARRRAPREPVAAADVPAELRLRIDLCWSAGKGLGFIDPIRAAAISAQGLRLALASGEPRRIARAAAYLTIVDINAPDPRRASAAARELALARGLATRLSDPHLTGLTTILTGVAALNNGQWQRALAGVEAGADLLRARCVGVHWERAIAHAMAMHALLMLGDFAGLRARAETWQHEAEDIGDRFALVVAILYTAHAALAAGEPERARAAVRKALSLWTYDGFSFQHWIALGIEVGCDLHDGRGRDAWARVERAWPALVRSQLMRMQIPRIDARRLRACAALAAARAGQPHLVRFAAADADALARERIELAHASEDLIRSQLAALDGRPADALLRRAADRFGAGHMPALAAAVRHGEARLAGRDTFDAELALGRCEIRDPARWAATVAPALYDMF